MTKLSGCSLSKIADTVIVFAIALAKIGSWPLWLRRTFVLTVPVALPIWLVSTVVVWVAIAVSAGLIIVAMLLFDVGGWAIRKVKDLWSLQNCP